LLKRGKKSSVTKGRYKSLANAKEDGAIVIGIGVFLNSVLNFVVLAVIIFTLVRSIKRKKQKDTVLCKFCYGPIHPQASRCPHCTTNLDSQSVCIHDIAEESEQEESTKFFKKSIKKQLSSIDLTDLTSTNGI